MADDYSSGPASAFTAGRNAYRIAKEEGISPSAALRITTELRDELREKGLRGFRHGGRVKRTGIYRLHKGERVISARKRKHRRY